MKILHALFTTSIAVAVATPSGGRSLEPPRILQRQAGNQSSSSSLQPNFTHAQLWDLNTKFLDAFIYPANVKEAKAINSTILAEDVQGRVDITRTFNGRELNTEYLFGLFANLAAADAGAISLLGIPLSYEVLHFAASQNVVAALTRFQFNFTALNLVLPVDIDAWNTYNSKGEITQYDATFKYWQWIVDYLIGAAAKKFGTKSPEATVGVLTQTIAKSICGTAVKSCNGTNTQYASPTECFNFLTKQVRFGKAYELGKNTLLCRMVHQNMVPFRPDVHCSHIGPSGGGYCSDDKSYVQTVSENYFDRSPYVPFGFVGQGGGAAPGPGPVAA
ncbi:hypothetical protein XANCAGTX0491_002689 [Xanthoria calcicola]